VEEEARGLALACKTCPRSDIRVRAMSRIAVPDPALRTASPEFGPATAFRHSRPDDQET
jgi:hypothetical protein